MRSLKTHVYLNPQKDRDSRDEHRRQVWAQTESRLREIAGVCLGEVPCYQIFDTEGPQDHYDILLVVTRNKGKIVGFTSSLIFHVPEVGQVLHLGLTCVDPSFQGKKVSQILVKKLIFHYWANYGIFHRVWISNLACVLSSLGNVAKNFKEVYPSPHHQALPSVEHLKISRFINENCRRELYINSDAHFVADKNVFQASVDGTMFAKSTLDSRYFHRKADFNNFYNSICNIDGGDEVLQIGWMDTFGLASRSIDPLKKKVRSFAKKLVPGHETTIS